MIVLDVAHAGAVVVKGVERGEQLAPLVVRAQADLARHVVGEEHGDGVDERLGAVRLRKVDAGAAVAHQTALLLARRLQQQQPLAVAVDGALHVELAQQRGDARAVRVAGAELCGDIVAVAAVSLRHGADARAGRAPLHGARGGTAGRGRVRVGRGARRRAGAAGGGGGGVYGLGRYGGWGGGGGRRLRAGGARARARTRRLRATRGARGGGGRRRANCGRARAIAIAGRARRGAARRGVTCNARAHSQGGARRARAQSRERRSRDCKWAAASLPAARTAARRAAHGTCARGALRAPPPRRRRRVPAAVGAAAAAAARRRRRPPPVPCAVRCSAFLPRNAKLQKQKKKKTKKKKAQPP
ncbi:hypothetical protein FGB62_14g048 [Gracilaria domingensis]|nr:hypothetical protein FGB62_14g048 [Gracilaria domingensis]